MWLKAPDDRHAMTTSFLRIRWLAVLTVLVIAAVLSACGGSPAPTPVTLSCSGKIWRIRERSGAETRIYCQDGTGTT